MLLLLAGRIDGLTDRWRRWVVAGVASSVLLLVVAFFPLCFGLASTKAPFKDLRGWRESVATVAQQAQSVQFLMVPSLSLIHILVSNQVLPLVASVRQLPVKEAGLLARQLQAPAVMWGINAPSFSVYSGRIVERREPRPGDVVLTQSARLPALASHELLYQQHGIALARISPTVADDEAASCAPATACSQTTGPTP